MLTNKEREKRKREKRKLNPKRLAQHKLNQTKSDLKRKYGITLGQYEELKLMQDNKCAICKTPSNECSKGILFVDHNHNTGKVRGLLCNKCNAAIGLLNENILLFEAAKSYLK